MCLNRFRICFPRGENPYSICYNPNNNIDVIYTRKKQQQKNFLIESTTHHN